MSLLRLITVTAAGTVNETAGTVTIPIYKGVVNKPGSKGTGEGKEVFYVVTDTTDQGNADALGLNYSPKLRFGSVGKGARKAYLDKDTVCGCHVNLAKPMLIIEDSGCHLGIMYDLLSAHLLKQYPYACIRLSVEPSVYMHCLVP
jgi:hypothetical protein